MADAARPGGRRARRYAAAAVAPAALARRAAWASWPGTCRALPSHHGHVTVDGSPPRFEMTRPVPRQGAHGFGSAAG